MDNIEEHRRFFAQLITANVGIPPGSELEAAFASVPREQFVGSPPWRIFTPVGYIHSSSNNPALLYQDVVVSLGTDKPLNNGQPSLHAYCIHALGIQKSETVLHIGAGSGYYTTILARLVGESGSVIAYEIEPELAERASHNLAALPQVTAHERSGAQGPLPACDAIYVNAGATEPLAVWLDALKPQGRLLFPLTSSTSGGAMLLVTKQNEAEFKARFLMPVMFVPCIGARDERTAARLDKAFTAGNLNKVKSLHRNDSPDGSCWFAGNGWWLSTK